MKGDILIPNKLACELLGVTFMELCELTDDGRTIEEILEEAKSNL